MAAHLALSGGSGTATGGGGLPLFLPLLFLSPTLLPMLLLTFLRGPAGKTEREGVCAFVEGKREVRGEQEFNFYSWLEISRHSRNHLVWWFTRW